MFEANTLRAVTPLVVHAKPLSVVQDSPLSTIVRTLGLPGMSDSETVEQAVEKVNAAASNPESGHTAFMQEAKQVIAASVRRTLDLCHNVVRPHIASVIEAYDAKMKDFAEAAISPYKIKKTYLEDIYKDPIIQDLLTASAGMTKLSMLNEPAVIGVYPREEIFRLLSIADQRNINSNLFALLNSDEGQGLVGVQQVLEGRTSIAEVLKYHPNLSLPLIIILRAIETPTEGVVGPLSRWEATKTQMINNAYTVMRDYLARFENVMKYKILYDVNAPKEANVITLNGEVYNWYLEKGLTANAVIGNEILKRPYRGEEILQHITRLEEAYGKEQVLLQQTHSVKRRTSEVNAMIAALREDVAARGAEGKFLLEGDTAEKANGRMHVLLEKITTGPHRNDNILLLITAVVIGTWYAHTDARHFFDCSFEIEFGSAAGGLPPEEIRTMATIRYLTQWVRSQIVTA